MSEIVTNALALWGMEGARFELVATRENRVYRVDQGGASYALRLHRQGYRSDAELRSELQWMDAAASGGLHVPYPIASISNDLLHIVDGCQVDVLCWLAGAPMGVGGTNPAHEGREGLFRAIGREMARLHAVSDAWRPPPGFTRWAWDREGLLGETPVWGRFWENPTLTDDEKNLFETLQQVAAQDLAEREASMDYGLIHADLVRENVIVDDEKIQLIDFDDGGFGFRLFDLATALVKCTHEADYSLLKSSLLEGYRSVRPIDTGAFDLIMALRAATYVGWIIERLGEEGALARNRCNIETAKMLANAYLAKTRALPTGHRRPE
ncbi:MAG: phosphotransferase enzyme family protein [Geminicoccaceae bacterium]